MPMFVCRYICTYMNNSAGRNQTNNFPRERNIMFKFIASISGSNISIFDGAMASTVMRATVIRVASSGFSTRSDINQTVPSLKSKKMAKGLKFPI